MNLQKKLRLSKQLADKYRGASSYSLLGLVGRLLSEKRTRNSIGRLVYGATVNEIQAVINPDKNHMSNGDYPSLNTDPPDSLSEFLNFVKKYQ